MRMFKGFLVVAGVLMMASGAAAIDQVGSLSGVVPPGGYAPDVVLYDQTANATGNLSSTQNFEAAFDAYDAEGADDFIVTYPDGWNVEEVGTVAGYWNGTGPAASMNVAFYSDSSGMPGSAVAGCTFMNVPYTDTSGNFLMTLPSICYLPAGTYWVSVQGNLDFAVGGQFGWATSDPQVNNLAHWRNPGDGFGTGCTSWTPRINCSTLTDPDYAFAILGEEAPPGATPTPPPAVSSEPVPAMNRYGIVVMVALLIGVAILVMWRRN